MNNFLARLFGGPKQGAFTPPVYNNIMQMPEKQDRFGLPDRMQAPMPDAIMQRMQMPQQSQTPQQQTKPARQRRSALDIIGGLADTFATIEGATPLYAQNVNARRQQQYEDLQRQNEEIDRQREIALYPYKMQKMQDSATIDKQTIASNEVVTRAAQNEAVGQGMRAVFARSGPEGLAKAFPLVASQYGIPPEQQAAVMQALQTDPEGTLAALFPLQETKASPSADIQMAEYLAANGSPELKRKYLELIVNPAPKAMSEYQAGQLGVAREKVNLSRKKQNNPAPSAVEIKESIKADTKRQSVITGIADSRRIINEIKALIPVMVRTGAMYSPNQSTAGRVATGIKSRFPLIEEIVSAEGNSARTSMETLRKTLIDVYKPVRDGQKLGGGQLNSTSELEFHLGALSSAKDERSARAAVREIERVLDLRQKELDKQNQAPVRRSGILSPRPSANPARRQPTGKPRASAAPAFNRDDYYEANGKLYKK